MATERHDYRVRLGIDGVDASIADVERFRRILERITEAAQRTQVNIPEPNLQAAYQAMQGRIAATPTGQGFSPLQQAQTGVLRAQGRLEDALTGYARLLRDNETDPEKLRPAMDRLLGAYGSLQGAIQREVRAREAIANQALAPQRAEAAERAATEARVNRAHEQFLARQLREEERQLAAARRASVAEERRTASSIAAGRRHDALLAQKNATLENERRIAQKRADAIAAFSGMPVVPGQGALSQAEIDRMSAAPIRQARDTDRIYSLRQTLADRQLQAEASALRMQEAINAARQGTAGSEEQLRARLASAISARDASSRAVIAAERKLANAINDAAAVNATRSSSLRESFITGFRGQRDAPFAEQFGQAAKFSVFYGGAYRALFAITATLQATLQEGIEWQQAMTDLKIATGRPTEELNGIADQLASYAVEAGAMPSQGVLVGARAVGLYGATESPAAEQDRVARISAEVVSRLAVGSTAAPAELQGQVAAIAQALNLGAEGQFRIEDLDAYMTRRFGIAPGSTLQTVAESGTLGVAAGFSPEELFAISAQVQSRTGQTDSAVAGFLAQIFSRGGEGTMASVAERYGVDANQELADVVADLAEVFRTATPTEQAEISAAAGRGRSQGAFAALLQGWDEIQQRVDEATAGAAAGAGVEAFEERMNNLGGMIAQLQGRFGEFAGLLGQSGLLDLLGLGVITLDAFVGMLNEVLRTFNTLPAVVRDFAWALAAAAVAARFTQAGSLTGLAGAARNRYRLGQTGVDRGLAMASMGTNIGGASGALRSTGALGGLRALGSVGAEALGLAGPIGLAIGGLMAISSLRQSAENLAAAQEQATAVYEAAPLGLTSDPNEYSARAEEYRSVAQTSQDAQGFWTGLLRWGGAGDPGDQRAEVYRREAEYLDEAAGRMADAAESMTTVEPGLIRGFDEDSIQAAMDTLSDSGVGAASRLGILTSAIAGAGTAAEQAAAQFDPETFATGVAGGFQDAMRQALEASQITLREIDPGARGGVSEVPVSEFLAENGYTQQEIMQATQRAMERFGVQSEGDLSGEMRTRIAEYVVETNLVSIQGAIGPEGHRLLVDAVRESLDVQVGEAFRAISAVGTITSEEATTLMNSVLGTLDASLGDLGERDFGARRTLLRTALEGLRNAAGRTEGGATEEMVNSLASVREQLVQNNIDELESLRQVALRNARSRSQALRTSRRYVTRRIGAVVRGGGTAEQLASVLEGAGRWAIDEARNAIDAALKIARAALAVQQAMAQAANRMLSQELAGNQMGGLGPQVGVPQTTDEIERLQGLRNDLRYVVGGTREDEISTYTSSPQGQREAERLREEEEAATEERDSAAAIAAARARAAAARSGGNIAAARASIASARASLADAERGTVEWFDALASLHDAQRAMNDAVLAHQTNLRLLSIDMTNPLAMARAETRAAARQLASDRRRNQAPDVIAQSRVDLRNAQANEEATRFNQRLQSVQTAEELGRISHSRYMDYLDNERERLSRIKDRTFQQQEQLNQIDGLIQEANRAMSGQFNFGDINVPTPYQVRRYMEEQVRRATGGPNIGPRVPAGSTTIYINGADTGQVTRIINDKVGKNARIKTTATRRR